MWAYLRVLVDTLVEQEVRSSGMAHDELDTLPRDYLEAKYDPQPRVDTLPRNTAPGLAYSCLTPYPPLSLPQLDSGEGV